MGKSESENLSIKKALDVVKSFKDILIHNTFFLKFIQCIIRVIQTMRNCEFFLLLLLSYDLFLFFFMCSVVACIEYYVVFNYYSFLFFLFHFLIFILFLLLFEIVHSVGFHEVFFFSFFFFLQCIVNKIHSFLIVAPHKFIPHNLICSNLMNQMDKNLIFLTLCCYFFCFVCFIWSEI